MMTIESLYQLFREHPKICTDSRKVIRGGLFFALKGQNFDGNRFALQALASGAARAVTDSNEVPEHGLVIKVNDVLSTLQQLATFHRQQFAIPIIAITGSNGKTTTKELVTAVLSQKFRTLATAGNLNNHIGVPLTLLGFSPETEMGVVEMGANHPGEIDFLCRIALPDYGIVTNMGKAHLEGFGGIEGVIKTKSELYRHLEKNGKTIFINSDNPTLMNAAGSLLKKITYGTGEYCRLRGEYIPSGSFLNLKVWFPKGILYINTRLTGAYNLENVLAAAAVGLHFGVDPLLIKKAIEGYEPSNNRSQRISAGSNQVIMDAYNANPTSMEASLVSFKQMPHTKKVVILGDMLELGAAAPTEHQRIIDILGELNSSQVLLTGHHFGNTLRPGNYQWFPDSESIAAYLRQNPILNSLILIKGSRGMALEKLIPFLEQ